MRKYYLLFTVILGGLLIAAAPFSHWIQFQAQDEFYKILDSSGNPVFSWRQANKAARAYGSLTTDGILYANEVMNASKGLTLSGTTSNIALGSNYLSGDGGDEGISVDSSGNVTATGSIYIDTSGQPQQFSTYTGANSNGYNLFIGGGGNSSVGAVGETYKGSSNVAYGFNSLYYNTIGYYNSAFGLYSLFNNNAGHSNTASGVQSLYSNTTGNNNIAYGYNSLLNNTTGYHNSALGVNSLYNNTGGSHNTSVGVNSLYYSNGAGLNTAIGYEAGMYIAGDVANTSPTCSVFVGLGTKGLNADDTNTVVIGYGVQGTGSNSVVIGNDSITQTTLKGNVTTAGNIQGASITATTGMQASYYTVNSTERIKRDITDLNGIPVTKFVRQEKPVIRRYRMDPEIKKPKIENYKDISRIIVTATEIVSVTKDSSKVGTFLPTPAKTEIVTATKVVIDKSAKDQYDEAIKKWENDSKSEYYTKEREGFIVEELPEKYLGIYEGTWDIQEFIVDQEKRIQDLEKRVAKLEGAGK